MQTVPFYWQVLCERVMQCWIYFCSIHRLKVRLQGVWVLSVKQLIAFIFTTCMSCCSDTQIYDPCLKSGLQVQVSLDTSIEPCNSMYYITISRTYALQVRTRLTARPPSFPMWDRHQMLLRCGRNSHRSDSLPMSFEVAFCFSVTPVAIPSASVDAFNASSTTWINDASSVSCLIQNQKTSFYF